MDEMNILFPVPTGQRNADDMGMPGPSNRFNDDTLGQIIVALQARVAELEAELRCQNEANDMIATERDAFAKERGNWVAYCAAAGADLAAVRAKLAHAYEYLSIKEMEIIDVAAMAGKDAK